MSGKEGELRPGVGKSARNEEERVIRRSMLIRGGGGCVNFSNSSRSLLPPTSERKTRKEGRPFAYA